MVKEVNYKDWNYQEMGFESQEELRKSYDRVMEEMKKCGGIYEQIQQGGQGGQ